MNFYLLMSALRARFRVFALILLATVLVTAVISLLLPKKYTATASLLVDARDVLGAEARDAPTLVQPFGAVGARDLVGYLQTQVDVITSHKVAEKVVRDMKLTENSEARAQWESDTGGKGSFENWLADELLKYIKVDTSLSSIMRVSYTSADPGFAAATANAFAKAYQDAMLELRVHPTREAAAWFDEQLKALRANLEASYSKLSTYQREKGIASADQRFDIENSKLAELSTQLVQAQGQTYDARTREQQAREFLAQGAAADKIPEVIANPFIQGLKTELLRGEARLQELSTQYGSAYPLVQTQIADNEGLRERLNREMSKIVDGLDNAASTSTRREAQLREAVDAQRARVLQLKGGRDQVAVLTRDVETAQRAYDTALQRSIASRVESRARQTNIALLTAAVEPIDPAKPKILVNVALSIVVGVMLGLGMVVLMETIDRRVRSYDDLYVGTNVPVLAVLHGSGTSGQIAGRFAGYALPKPA